MYPPRSLAGSAGAGSVRKRRVLGFPRAIQERVRNVSASQNRRRFALHGRWMWRAFIFLGLVAEAALAAAVPLTLPARAVTYRPEMRGWAHVDTVAPLVLRTRVAARVQTLDVMPGQTVAAGQVLATLGGPAFAAALATAQARSQAAQAEFAAAQRTLTSSRQTLGLTTDRKALDAAEAALGAAQGRAASAHAALAGLRAQRTVSSPSAATVSAVQAAPGADLPAGAPLLTLVPRRSLWLRVEWFDSARPPAHARAHFIPTGGSTETEVHLMATLPERAADGARVLNFAAVGASTWQAGDTGELLWQGPAQEAVAVPAEALVLSAGRWYVLTDSAGKLAAQPVTPGPSRGAEVLITQGLQPGQRVVVRQADLLFHRGFAARYTPPD